MAELDVQPKKSNSWWFWLLLVIIIIGLLFFFLKGCNTGQTTMLRDTTGTDSAGGANRPVAATAPDYDAVDFNSPVSTDPDVTDKDIIVSGSDKYTIYSLGENILFPLYKSTLQSSADNKLKQISASLNKRFKGSEIGVYGSADSIGTKSDNKQMGAERAQAVKMWLVNNAGIDSTRISVHSLGETHPVASNATAAGRKQNRNVSIVAFPNNK